MGKERLFRADAATEAGLARFLEQYARLLAARRRRDGIGPTDAYYASKTLAAAAALLRLHLQKYALYGEAAAGVLEPDEPDAARRLSRATRAMRALLLTPRPAPWTSAQASASLADLEAFYARKRETEGDPEAAPPSPPWLHSKVSKT